MTRPGIEPRSPGPLANKEVEIFSSIFVSSLLKFELFVVF